MQYLNLPFLPSPLAGLGEATKTISDAVVENQTRRALGEDMTLIGKTMADLEAKKMAGGTMEDYTGAYKTTLEQMKTPQGQQTMVKSFSDWVPKTYQPVSPEGKLGTPYTVPPRTEVVQTKRDPLELQAVRDAAAAERQDKRDLSLDKRAAERDAAAERRAADHQRTMFQMQTMRDEALEKRDMRRYDQTTVLMDKRQDFQLNLQEKKTEKDRTEYARRELVNVRQRAKENYTRRVGTIQKDVMILPDKKKQILAEAQRDYDTDLTMINQAYADVIERYGIDTGAGTGAQDDSPGGKAVSGAAAGAAGRGPKAGADGKLPSWW